MFSLLSSLRSLLAVLALGGADAGASDPHAAVDAVAQAVDGNPIRMGDTRSGTLQQGDRTLSSGEFVDEYVFVGEAGELVEMTLTSSSFDTYLIVRGGGVSEENDDMSDGSTNSRVRVRLPNAGTYRVGVTSYAVGETGDYTLTVGAPNASGRAVAAAPSSAPPQASSRSSRPTPANAAVLEPGVAATGALTDGDRTLRTGEFNDLWILETEAGEAYRVTLESNALDPYLLVRGPGGLSRDNDDAGDGTTNSAVTFTAIESGPVQVMATSYAPGETGGYTIRADRERSASARPAVSVLQPGSPTRGRLDEGRRTPDGQRFEQAFTFRAREGQRATVRLTTTQFEGVVTVRMPNGAVESARDRERGRAPVELFTTLPQTGEYTVLVSSQQSGATGDFAITLQLGDVEQVLATGAAGGGVASNGSAASAAGQLTLGATVNGRLRRSDEQLGSGEFLERYTFEGEAGTGITVSMASTDMDTYLILRGPNGFAVDNDDVGTSTDSQIEATLPTSGTYTILATTYAPNTTGSYTLALAEGTTLQRNRRGRVYAVLAGISDYSGSHNDLPYCAEDAQHLHASLRSTGLLADESVVLTDGQVTRRNLEQAFSRVAAAAGPDDVFVFFYSGHGSTQPNNREIDGTDETLVLIDGEVTDDEVSAWFDQVDARVGMIALDSCFSGGFARDVISRPGLMGIFSSEEDVTSNVAARFQAGGYLSYFLRAAFEGSADDAPSDGITTAGELTQYLRRQWASHNMVNEETQTTDDRVAYQNLVIDRGSVKVEDVLVY